MTKSEEYLEEYCRHFYGGTKTMKHKNLEDVEGMINGIEKKKDYDAKQVTKWIIKKLKTLKL